MIVLYRICPFSNGKSPLFANDKLALVAFCLKSFVKAFESVKPRVIFILDSCPPQYKKLLEKTVPFKYDVEAGENIGFVGSFFKQLDLAIQFPKDTPILLQEDDYYYLPGSGEKITAGINSFDFITPYDHPEHYRHPWCNIPQHIVLIGGHHWRSYVSTCLTFGTKAGKIKDNLDLIKSFGVADHPMWTTLLPSKGYKLYGPIPSLATHLVKGLLAPNISWEKIWQKLQ